MKVDTDARHTYQPKLFKLSEGFDSNGHWYKWVGYDGREMSRRTYNRVSAAGSDCVQDGIGCPVGDMSDSAIYRLYLGRLMGWAE